MNGQTQSLLQAVRALPAHSVTTSIRSPRGKSTRTFRGALLYDYIRAAGTAPERHVATLGSYYLVVTAEDGFSAALAYFEVAPQATDKQVLLAYEQDGEPLRTGVRLVVPGDDLGGRSITGVTDIKVRSVPSSGPGGKSRSTSDGISLDGLVELPGELRMDDLSRFQQQEAVTRETPRHGGAVAAPRQYSGVPLWDVLAHVRPVLDPKVNEDILRRVVVARGTDGYAAVIAAGELDPRFMGGRVLIATACEGQPLPEEDGLFRLVVPYDRAVGRALKCLQSIEVLQA